MKQPECSLTSQQAFRQEVFWRLVQEQVTRLVSELIHRLLDAALSDHIKAGWNQRTADRTGFRNGYYRRGLTTPHGQMAVRIPRCRQGGLDTTAVFDRYQRRIADVERVLRHAYLLGASTRALSELAEQLYGGCMSHQTISQLMRWLDEQIGGWRNRPLEPIYPIVYIDGMYVTVEGERRVVMLAAAERYDGTFEILDFRMSRSECCLDMLKDLRLRGLDGVKILISDDSGAIRRALEEEYPLVPWQSCTFHRLARLRDNIGAAEYRNLMVKDAARIFRCPSRDAAISVACIWAKKWRQFAPYAVELFMEGLTDSLTFYDMPINMWKKVRTNNRLERLIRTLRARLDPMGSFQNQEAASRAVFGQLLRWHKINLTHNT
ncbi:MAG TPA: IS256 family transposase [Sedimentisphaerales bacterium]|nr:IS256 family transposase [Sedimentisphaerales bacterium]